MRTLSPVNPLAAVGLGERPACSHLCTPEWATWAGAVGLSLLAVALVLGTVPARLAAQTDASPVSAARAAAVAALSRALANTAAHRASAFARTGTHGWYPWRSDADSRVRLVTLEAGPAGWSRLALHEVDRGLRCAIVVGAAAPLLNTDSVRGRPFCVGDHGEPIAAGTGRDTSWVFWWEDEILDRVPALLECPPLRIPRLPNTNDSLYAEFVVGTNGRVEPSGVAVESTGDFDATVGMLLRLDGCRFEPAQLDGAPVRALVRHRLGLAPHRSRLPRRPPESPVINHSPAGRSDRLDAMRAALADVAAAQERHHAATGTYAAGIGQLDPAPATVPLVRVVMLSWSATVWAAIAVHDSTGDRCLYRVGGDPVPGEPGDGAGCYESDGVPLTALDTTAAEPVATPPSRRKCENRSPLRQSPGRNVEVILEFLIGLDGRPEPGMLRVVKSNGLRDAAAATWMVATCRYHPGREGKRPLRVLIRQPVMYVEVDPASLFRR
jgi:hypothetical protein